MTGHEPQLPRRRPASSCPNSNSNSKQNRAKPPVVIAHECPSAMRAHVVEVPAGRDVLSCVSAFARRGRRGALVLGAAGHVTDVVLREPALVLRGTMEILSLAGCFFPFPGPGSAATGTAVFLAGPRGSVLGGGVALGGLVAAGPVVVMVATFVAAALDRLPLAKGAEEAAGKGCDEHAHHRHRACGWAAVMCRKQRQQLGANS
jgi:predicted DNA-binding protein with PD1-like motif